MHHRLSKFHKFAQERPADANRAEALARPELSWAILGRIARPVDCAVLGLVLVLFTTPRPLWSQGFSAPNNSIARGGASRANILGRIVDQTGRPLTNLEIAVKDVNGNLLRTVRTNTIGRYCLTDLATGHYLLTQDPARAPFDGQTVVTSLPPEGLFIDWRVAGNSAIALASTPREAYACPQFLAGDTLLEKIFGVVSNQMLAGGSIAAGLGVAAGAVAGGAKNNPVASPSK